MDDHDIVKLYWERSEAAITALADKYSKYCMRIANNILNDKQDAEECVNDTYLRTWNAIPPALPMNLLTFLGKITRNLALNRLEKYHAQKRNFGQSAIALSELEECIPDMTATPENFAESETITQTINLFLTGLSEINRKIFMRRYWYMSGIDEIASDHGMSVSKVKSILFRTRKKLKKFLEKEGISL